MAQLVTRDRALKSVANASSTDKSRVDALILSATDAIETYCNRHFVATDYTERYGTEEYGGGREIYLDQTPVNSVSRVATWKTGVLRIENTSDSNQIARVISTSTGLTLTRIASGVSSSSTVAFSTSVTVGAVATAIVALGNGWTAEAVTEYTSWPSSYLYAKQGPQNAKDGQVYLYLFDEDIDEVELVDDEAGLLKGCFPRGRDNVWVEYNAGYTQTLDQNINNVPQDLQQACAQLVAYWYSYSEKDPLLQSEKLGDYSYSRGFERVGQDVPMMPPEVRALINPYRRIRL